MGSFVLVLVVVSGSSSSSCVPLLVPPSLEVHIFNFRRGTPSGVKITSESITFALRGMPASVASFESEAFAALSEVRAISPQCKL